METGLRFIVPSSGLEKTGIEPATPGLPLHHAVHITTAPRSQRFGKKIKKNVNTSVLLYISGVKVDLTSTHYQHNLFGTK